MARYIVDSQIDNHEKYYFIREQESQDIVLLPSKYLMHKKRSKLSPNTIRRSAGAISYYLNYIDETGIQLDDVWEMPYNKQQEHFTDYLIWLQAGLHSGDSYKKKPYNETCNAYLKEVFRFYRFSGQQDESTKQLKVLSDMRIIVHNSVGVKRTLYRNTFHGYLQEKGHIGKTIEQDKIVILLKACANCRDQILLLLLAETGFRIGELLGVRYATDIDYERHLLYVNFREDNENGARAKNAEYRKAKISDATFEILQFYIEEYKDLIFQQEYLIINISGDYAGKPMQDSGVYALMERLQKKTGIKVTPHMLRHYFAKTMRNEGERITVSGLCKRTGLSNSFFYRNPKIKEEVHKAVDIQNQSYKMNIDEVELLDEYKEKLLAMRIEIIKLKAENQKLESELDFLRRQQEGVSDVK